MDEPTNTFNTPPEPEITLPLSTFLQILWGYKKGADLRERAIPGADIVALLSAVPDYQRYYHIQKNPDGEDTVWQRDEWKSSGLREEERDTSLRVYWQGIEDIMTVISPRFPMFTREQLRPFVEGLIQRKEWTMLQGMGVDTAELEKRIK